MIRGNDKARFLSYIDKGGSNLCWLWNGWRDKDGYGKFRVGESKMPAHRYSYILHVGPIPDGMCILHTCDTPPCVNPAHLMPGTNRQNIDDMLSKGRQRKGLNHPRKLMPREVFAQGSRVGTAKLNECSVIAIRARIASGESCRSIARRYNVSHMTILRIKDSKAWNHV